jgi:hypothetical protein
MPKPKRRLAGKPFGTPDAAEDRGGKAALLPLVEPNDFAAPSETLDLANSWSDELSLLR